MVAFFPPLHSAMTKANESIKANFGTIKNVDDEDTVVEFELSFRHNQRVHNGYKVFDVFDSRCRTPVTASNTTGVSVSATLNGDAIDLPTFDIVENVLKPKMLVSKFF